MWSVCLGRTNSSVTNREKPSIDQQIKTAQTAGIFVPMPITGHQAGFPSLGHTRSQHRLRAWNVVIDQAEISVGHSSKTS